MKKFSLSGRPFLSSFLIALLISIAFILVLNLVLPRRELVMKEQKRTSPGSYYHYADLNQDGTTEEFHTYIWNDSLLSCPFYTIGEELIRQSNFSGGNLRYPERSAIIGDYDHNGYQEVYFFSRKSDSILLNAVELGGREDFIQNRFIATINKGKSGYDAGLVKSSYFIDTDKDGNDELFFGITSGYSIYPRMICRYNIGKDSLLHSMAMGTKLQDFNLRKDNQGQLHFLWLGYAAGNMHDTTAAYHDGDAYLISMNTDLEFSFPPIKHAGETSTVRPFPFEYKEKSCIFVYKHKSTSYKEEGYSFYLIDDKGKELAYRNYPFEGRKHDLYPMLLQIDGKQRVYILKGRRLLYRLEEDLSLSKVYEFPYKVSYNYNFDINNDGKGEFLGVSSNYDHIFVADIAHHRYYDIDMMLPVKTTRILPIKGKYEDPSVFYQAEDLLIYLTLASKPYYYFYLLIYGVAMLLFSFTLIYFAQMIAVKQANRKKRMAELQLANWRNQLNPHFTYNTLNSVGAVILKEDKEEAYKFFAKFSRLVAHAIDSSASISISLKKEFEFMDLYLQLEKFRFEEKFDYQIIIDDKIDQNIQVPKMFLQTYAENAIRHGLMDREVGGLLRISAREEEKYFCFEVEDNGIGRLAARRKRRFGHHMGMDLMSTFFEQLNSFNSKKILLQIEDLKPGEEEFPGTKVRINIPKDFSYEL